MERAVRGGGSSVDVHDDVTVAKQPPRTVPVVDVTLVRWPDEADTREALRRSGRARVLLLLSGSVPPTPVDELEDWIRVPVSDADLRARIEWLSRRLAPVRVQAEPPVIDEHGLIRNDGAWVSLPPVEGRLARALLERFGAVVSRDALARAGWPQGAPGRNALDVHVLRLRRRIDPVGLAIKTVRSRGYLLEASVPQPQPQQARAGYDRPTGT